MDLKQQQAVLRVSQLSCLEIFVFYSYANVSHLCLMFTKQELLDIALCLLNNETAFARQYLRNILVI